MLGKKVAEMTAVTANKMLPSNNGQPRFETSCEGTGTMLGVEGQFMATYWAQINPDGSVYGECPDSGVVLTAEGPVTFRANGAGAFTEDGSIFMYFNLNLSLNWVFQNITVLFL